MMLKELIIISKDSNKETRGKYSVEKLLMAELYVYTMNVNIHKGTYA